MNKPIIVRYGEIGIKSPKVRRRFENRLISNIKNIIKCEIELSPGRIFLYPTNYPDAIASLKKIFGIVSFSPAVSTKTDHNLIKKTLKKYINELFHEKLFSSENSFAIRCRRVGSHNFTSQEMAAFCGSVVVEETSASVDLSNPDLQLYIEVRGDKTYIFHDKISGPGGLPIGTQGRVIALLSDGIDSPVATYLMMKRGCAITILHFNNYPFTSGSLEKISKIVKKLKEYSSGSKFNFYQINYGECLKIYKNEAPPRMTCVLCKSGMYQLAEKLAKKENSLAIIDGNSLGQVASQTLPNILVTRYSIKMPVLSPLIGMDKLEIQEIAQEIGTFEISIQPENGCTAVPRYPETNAQLETVIEAQKDINMEQELETAFSSLKEIWLK